LFDFGGLSGPCAFEDRARARLSPKVGLCEVENFVSLSIENHLRNVRASLHQLEVTTGVNKSGLYSEFKDKEDLFMQILQYYLESLEKRGLLTAELLGWNNIERFLKMRLCGMEGQKGCFAVSSIREFTILLPQ
jgi:hypothetical protein